jgi:hypothetical protein
MAGDGVQGVLGAVGSILTSDDRTSATTVAPRVLQFWDEQNTNTDASCEERLERPRLE